MADKQVEVSTEIHADAQKLYDLVAELTEMGNWSPENTGGRWIGGATGPAVGAKFRGSNRSGWRRWSTTVQVTEADRGKRFSFRVTFAAVPIADWAYDFKDTGTATVVTETWTDLRPWWMEKGSAPVMGVWNRPEHNRANMEATLEALKRGAEAAR
ncbi:MAG TPA: SRPBCC family protein [Mycobacteriales bacterium]|nr:SRPBCC family protein [Mycobacteriales bacterium]